MKRPTLETRHLRTKIAVGNMLILLLPGGIITRSRYRHTATATQRNEKTDTVFFLPVNALQYLLPYLTRLVCVEPESKGDNRFKVVECSPTCRRDYIASLRGRRIKNSASVYRFDGGTERRGDYPEQLHQFRFGHPNITARDVHPAIFSDCYDFPFHTHLAIEISLNDWLSRLPNSVKSLSIFSVVILAYCCVVVMFVCPNTRLTLSMGTPLLKASVANP